MEGHWVAPEEILLTITCDFCKRTHDAYGRRAASTRDGEPYWYVSPKDLGCPGCGLIIPASIEPKESLA